MSITIVFMALNFNLENCNDDKFCAVSISYLRFVNVPFNNLKKKEQKIEYD